MKVLTFCWPFMWLAQRNERFLWVSQQQGVAHWDHVFLLTAYCFNKIQFLLSWFFFLFVCFNVISKIAFIGKHHSWHKQKATVEQEGSSTEQDSECSHAAAPPLPGGSGHRFISQGGFLGTLPPPRTRGTPCTSSCPSKDTSQFLSQYPTASPPQMGPCTTLRHISGTLANKLHRNLMSASSVQFHSLVCP